MKRPSIEAWALLALLGLIWGASFMLTKIAVADLPPMTLVALRLAMAAAALSGVAAAMGARGPRGRRLWVYAAAAGVSGAVAPFWLISFAQIHIPSAVTGVLMAPMPLLSLGFAAIFVPGERFTALRVVGFGAGFVGVLILVGPAALEAAGSSEGGDLTLLAYAASLGAATCYAMNGIVVKRAEADDMFGFGAAILVTSAAIAAAIAGLTETPDLAAVEAQAWAATIALGLGATAAGQVLLMRIIALAGPPFFASVNYQVPLWAVVFGVAFLGEATPPGFWLALVLILSGLAAAQYGDAIGRRQGARSAPPRV
ncbi:MAG: DMT family transporter [Pseudomonadota bacterium]